MNAELFQIDSHLSGFELDAFEGTTKQRYALRCFLREIPYQDPKQLRPVLSISIEEVSTGAKHEDTKLSTKYSKERKDDRIDKV